jgi:hypothetical protein
MQSTLFFREHDKTSNRFLVRRRTHQERHEQKQLEKKTNKQTTASVNQRHSASLPNHCNKPMFSQTNNSRPKPSLGKRAPEPPNKKIASHQKHKKQPIDPGKDREKPKKQVYLAV